MSRRRIITRCYFACSRRCMQIHLQLQEPYLLPINSSLVVQNSRLPSKLLQAILKLRLNCSKKYSYLYNLLFHIIRCKGTKKFAIVQVFAYFLIKFIAYSKSNGGFGFSNALHMPPGRPLTKPLNSIIINSEATS